MTHWQARVEYAGTLTDEQAATLVDRDPSGAVVTTDPDRNRTALSIGVQASTLRLAIDSTLRQARDLVAGVITTAPTAIRVLSDADLAAEVERPSIPELIDTPGVGQLLGVTQQRVDQLRRRGDFPAPVQVFAGGRAVWVKAAIEAFNDRWDRRPGRPPATEGRSTR